MTQPVFTLPLKMDDNRADKLLSRLLFSSDGKCLWSMFTACGSELFCSGRFVVLSNEFVGAVAGGILSAGLGYSLRLNG